jgi:hypothetical protein
VARKLPIVDGSREFPPCFGFYQERHEQCSGDKTSEDSIRRAPCGVRDSCFAARRIGREELGIEQVGRAKTLVKMESLVAIARHIAKWKIQDGQLAVTPSRLRLLPRKLSGDEVEFATARLLRDDVVETAIAESKKARRETRRELLGEARVLRDCFLATLRKLWPRRAARHPETARMGDWHYELGGSVRLKSGPTLDIYVRSDGGYFRALKVRLIQLPKPGLRIFTRAEPSDIVPLVPRELASKIQIRPSTEQFGTYHSQWVGRGKQEAVALAEMVVAADKRGVLW